MTPSSIALIYRSVVVSFPYIFTARSPDCNTRADKQGVIIGVGLYVIESTFSAKTGPVDTPPKTPPSKRRRKDARLGNKAHTLTEAEIDQDEDNDEEVEDYASGLGIYGGRASSAAAGTGYAGNVKEDVSGRSSRTAAAVFYRLSSSVMTSWLIQPAIRADQSASKPEAIRCQIRPSARAGPSVSSATESARRSPHLGSSRSPHCAGASQTT